MMMKTRNRLHEVSNNDIIIDNIWDKTEHHRIVDIPEDRENNGEDSVWNESLCMSLLWLVFDDKNPTNCQKKKCCFHTHE